MTLPIERARSRRPITWLTLLGVLLLPVVIGGILVSALYNPVERLDSVKAAIVNEDEAVTINDQLVPLGRQLTAGLVEGSDDVPSNLDWVISNADDAAEGLADGTYTAVITIPAGFSAAATSTTDGATAEQATIHVETAPDALVVDDAITATITQTAASVFGQALSKSYLENVFVGFTTLGTKLGEAAEGADELASGARGAADGAAALPGGASQLASGANGIAGGASSLSSGLTKLANGTKQSASGAGQLADGLDQVSGQLTSKKDGTLGGAAASAAQYAGQAAASTKSLATDYQGLMAQYHCSAPTTSEEIAVCTALGTLAKDVTDSATSAGYASGYASGVQSGLGKTATGIDKLAGGAASLQSGLTQIADGIGQSAAGATKLSTGAAQLGDGATQLSTGAQSLADGVAQLADGTDELAGGLHTAAKSVPAYDDSGAQNLATVLSDPVAAKGLGTNLFGASAVPLLAMLALWFGGIASYIALQAVSRRTLTSRRPSVLLALQSLWPAAAIGAVQGLLVASVVQLAATYDVGTWSVFAAVCVLAGVAFAAVNQALVAVFSGAGRWIAALVGVFAVATGIVSTAPGILSAIAGILPTSPAYTAMVGALTSAGGVGAGIAGLLIWTLIAFVTTTLVVARRRSTSAKALLRAPLPA
jgi:putative membrane protein